MPIVSAMGGNAGTQTLAVMVRALATNQLTSSNTVAMLGPRVPRRRLQRRRPAVLIGDSAPSSSSAIRDLSAVFAAAMVINNLIAGLAGVLVPVALDRSEHRSGGLSAVFVTTMTDVMGFLSFLASRPLLGADGGCAPHIAMPCSTSPKSPSARPASSISPNGCARARRKAVFLTTRYLPKRHEEVAGAGLALLDHQAPARRALADPAFRRGGGRPRRHPHRSRPGPRPAAPQARAPGLALSRGGGRAGGSRRRAQRHGGHAARAVGKLAELALI